MARKRNPRLTSAQRDALPSRDFGLPRERKYPMPDAAHAIDAKARAKEELEKDRISISDYRKIIRKADKIIARHVDRAIPAAEIPDDPYWGVPPDLEMYAGRRLGILTNPGRRKYRGV